MNILKAITVIGFASIFSAGCGDSNILATVDGHDITKAEFNAFLKFKHVPEQDKVQVDRALDEYLKRAALVAAIGKSDKLDKALTQAELEEFRRQMLIGRYFEEHLKQSVDDDTVHKYYANNAAQYETQRVHAAHILIRVNSNMTEQERQAKLTSAHAAYSRIQKGEDFAAVAKALSEDTVSGAKGGDLGWLQEGAVDPEFSKHLWALKVGEVSEPFLTPFGFHIVKQLEGAQVVKRPVESVEGDIRYQLRNQAKAEETERLLKSITIKRKD
ncbi:MAG: peptidylprolyl isomerase [Marinagarivorans sp.]